MTDAARTRTTALPGPGVGVGRFWTVRGSVVEVTTKARWVWGRVDAISMLVFWGNIGNWLEVRKK